MSTEDCRWFLEDRLTTIVGQLAPSEQLGFVSQVSIAFYRRRGNPTGTPLRSPPPGRCWARRRASVVGAEALLS